MLYRALMMRSAAETAHTTLAATTSRGGEAVFKASVPHPPCGGDYSFGGNKGGSSGVAKTTGMPLLPSLNVL